jgi:hypothetical protein
MILNYLPGWCVFGQQIISKLSYAFSCHISQWSNVYIVKCFIYNTYLHNIYIIAIFMIQKNITAV